MTGFPQRACIRVAKNNEIFRLQHNNEVFFVASDRHLSPWLNKMINRTSSYQHMPPPYMLAHPRGLLPPLPSRASRVGGNDDPHDLASKGRTAARSDTAYVSFLLFSELGHGRRLGRWCL
jgi:hypothetical protein